MHKLKIFTSLFLSFIIMTIAVKYFIPESPTQAASHLVLKLILTQDTQNILSVKSLNIEDGYPLDYKINLTSNYYALKIVGIGGQTLFEGRVFNKDILIVEGSAPIVKPLETLTLYLPYYKYTERIDINDEKGSTKLSINPRSYNLTPPKNIDTNLCGNGICDVNENALSCYRDCKYMLPKFLQR